MGGRDGILRAYRGAIFFLCVCGCDERDRESGEVERGRRREGAGLIGT